MRPRWVGVHFGPGSLEQGNTTQGSKNNFLPPHLKIPGSMEQGYTTGVGGKVGEEEGKKKTMVSRSWLTFSNSFSPASGLSILRQGIIDCFILSKLLHTSHPYISKKSKFLLRKTSNTPIPTSWHLLTSTNIFKFIKPCFTTHQRIHRGVDPPIQKSDRWSVHF